MAEWRKVAMQLALGDGRIDTKEVDILRKLFLADGRVDKSEIEFLHEIKRKATSHVQALDKLIEECESKREG